MGYRQRSYFKTEIADGYGKPGGDSVRLSNLNTFVKVMKLKSISRAAEELHLTQPAVTKQLKALEEYYGVVLTQRQDNQVLPTREGKKLYGYAVSILTENCELLSAFKSELDVSSGHIDLIASNYPSQYIVPELITEMTGINENMTYSIRTTHSQDVYYHVKNGIYTFGFVGSKKIFPNIEILEVDTAEMVLVGLSEKYGWLADKPEELKNQTFVLRTKGSATLQEVKKHLDLSKMDRIRAFIECDSNEIVERLIRSGAGIGYYFEAAIRRGIEDGSLTVLDDKRIMREFYYIYNTQRYKSIAENAFHNHIIKKYSK